MALIPSEPRLMAKAKTTIWIPIMGSRNFKHNRLHVSIMGAPFKITVKVLAPKCDTHEEISHFAILLTPIEA